MEKNDIAPVVIGKLLNIGGLLRRSGNRILQEWNLNQHQYSILFSISQEKRVRQKNVINKLMLEKAHVSKVVKKLHGMGLVDIEDFDADRRSSWLSITEKGKKTVGEIQKRLKLWNRGWTDNLQAGELEKILESLTILQNELTKQAG